MLPSPSHLASKYGQINHYKNFWLLQTQLEKQEQALVAMPSSINSSLSFYGPSVALKDSNSKPLQLPTSLALLNGADSHSHSPIASTSASCRADNHIAATFSSCINGRSSTGGGCNSSCIGSTEVACVSSNYFVNLHRDHGGNDQVGIPVVRDNGRGLSLAMHCEGASAACKSAGVQQDRSLPTTASPLPSLRIDHQVQGSRQSISAILHDEKCDPSDSSIKLEKRVRATSVCQPASTSSPQLPRSITRDEDTSCMGFYASKLPHMRAYDPILSTSASPPIWLSAGSLRTCTLCGTTKTPLWRGGPYGPKSLCNACGIRVKKTKRMEAALQATGGISPSPSPSPAISVKNGPFKRKLTSKECSSTKKRGRKSSVSCQQSFPTNSYGTCEYGTPKLAKLLPERRGRDTVSGLANDVEDAAMMLMALSCGLVPLSLHEPCPIKSLQ